MTSRATLSVAPEYPAIAHQAGIAGAVTVRVSLERRGTVTDALVVDGPKLLSQSALAAAKLWEFESSPSASREVEILFVYTLVPENACFQKTLPRFSPPARVEVAARKVVPTCSDCGPSKPIRYETCQ